MCSSGRERRRFEPEDGFTALTISPDGKILAGATQENLTIRLWDLFTGKELRSIPVQRVGVSELAFSPDSSLLATWDWDGPIELWDTRSGDRI